MKKLLALMMVALLALSLAGCSGLVEDFSEGFKEGYNEALQEVAEDVNVDFVHGVVEGNVYKSEMSGLTFTAPETWTYMTDEELAEQMNMGIETQDLDAFTEAAAKLATVNEMMAYDVNNGTNVIIVYENLELSGNSGMTEDEYFEACKTSGAYTGMTVGELTDATLSGIAFKAVEIDNAGISQRQYLHSLGNYMCVVNITLGGGANFDEVEAMFG